MADLIVASIITGVATVLVTKAQEKFGQNIGDAVWKQGGKLANAAGKLITQLWEKKKVPSLTTALDENEPQRIDYLQAVSELKAAAEEDPEIAEALLEVEEAVKNDQSETAKKIQAKAEEIKSNIPDEVINIFQNEGPAVGQVKGTNSVGINYGTINN